MNHHDHAGHSHDETEDKLRYRIHVWRTDGTRQLLAKTATVALGRAIFKAAIEKNPTDRVTLGTDRRVFADSETQRGGDHADRRLGRGYQQAPVQERNRRCEGAPHRPEQCPEMRGPPDEDERGGIRPLVLTNAGRSFLVPQAVGENQEHSCGPERLRANALSVAVRMPRRRGGSNQAFACKYLSLRFSLGVAQQQSIRLPSGSECSASRQVASKHGTRSGLSNWAV